MAKKSPELLKYVEKLHKQGLKSTKIAEKIRKELGIEITDRTVRYWIKNEIEKGLKAVQKLNEKIEYDNPFVFEGDDIVFYVKSSDGEGLDRIALPIKVVEQIWTDYVKWGNNLTGQQIMEKYQLNPRAWHVLKSRLGLYKTSNILPDWLLEKIEKEKGEEEVEIKINEVSYKAAISKYKSKIARRYNQAKEKEYERAITKLYQIEDFLELLREYIDNYEPEKHLNIKQIKNQHERNNKGEGTLYTAITDIHIGKRETDKIINRFNEIAKELINRPEKRIVLFILGDLVEDLTIQGKHPGMLQKMDGPHGFELIMKTTNILEEFITGLYQNGKEVEVIGIAGNHDILDNKDVFDGSAAYIIYELVKRTLKLLNIKLEYYTEVWNKVDIDDFCFIINHGTGNHTKKKAQEILWEFGNNQKQNIILQGDKHHAELINVSKNATRILVPALAGENDYDKQLGVSSYPGFTIIKKGPNGKPRVEFIFLE